MKLAYLALLLILSAKVALSQESESRKIAAYLYGDYTTDGLSPSFWASYDINKFSVETRYNYDWDNTASLYVGAAIKRKNWKLRLMQGVTAGNGNVGVDLSPLAIYDGQKIFVYNNPQINLGISKMPNYFFHWGEAYYKVAHSAWVGVSDRLYFDNEITDKSFGPEVSFAYKEMFLNVYYWIPTSGTANRVSVLLAFEREFSTQK